MRRQVSVQERPPGDLRDEILKGVAGRKVTAAIIADDDGVLAETGMAAEEAVRLGLTVERILDEGTPVAGGDEIARLRGEPKQMVMAEDVLIGIMAKPSGIASAARTFVKRAGDRPRIVCGAWKKMPSSLKEAVRRAVVVGGAYYRISHDPFVYLDKNYIKILGGIRESLEAVDSLGNRIKVIQLKGRYSSIVEEAREAVAFGANILHIDTGSKGDVEQVVQELLLKGLRERVNIAFSGNIMLGDMDELKVLDIDILDIGRQIVDAPLMDMRMEVTQGDGGQ